MASTQAPVATASDAVAADPRPRPPVARRAVGLMLIAVTLLAVVALSLAIGARDVALGAVWSELVGGGSADPQAAGVLALRVPRTVLGLLVGAALGAAGALIQAVTRNPLADPGILGVNSGSAFAVAIAVGVLGVSSPTGYLWFAFAGALVTTVVVYLIGAAGKGSASPARMILAGVAIGAVLAGITSAMVLADPRGFNAMRAWEAGAIADRGWGVVTATAPYLAVGLVLALALGRSLNAVALGDDLARSLGSNVMRTRVLSFVAITLLCGGATAMAGPIAFVGLMIPHVARWIVGPDQRWIAAYSMLLGPILLLAADVLGRILLRPGRSRSAS
ncbi:ABC transporter permease [Litorihabitans aurantiacus]|uniref:ABC transporter permease n=1 Tax=Litorihabitans aurantiacus TaxID=1930061 RepID=A0AA38CUX5_9MICO|nr:ABC transporter permease [Litorihabitans aurantiacus]